MPWLGGDGWDAPIERAVDLMREVGIPNPGLRADAYPHELSGGLRQRATLAIALAAEPDLLVADEPTTALDTTTQAQILAKLREINRDRGTAMVVISHDLGVVAELCDRVLVMYAGQVMERGTTEAVFTNPSHPYTQALLACTTRGVDRTSDLDAIGGEVPDLLGGTDGCPFAPRCRHATDDCVSGSVPTREIDDGHDVACGELDAVPDGRSVSPVDDSDRSARRAVREGQQMTDDDAFVELRDVSKRFVVHDSLYHRLFGGREELTAVDGVDLSLRTGETLGLVGESGCGKSTLADLVTGLEAPTSGEVRLDGEPVGTVEDRPSSVRSDVGVVFQEPRASVNPRRTVHQTIAEPLEQQGWAAERRADRIRELLDQVGLPERHADSRPHQLSGGQLQRVALARAIALEPKLVVLDEPVSALDVSVQARILDLLRDLQDRLDLTYLFISHDLDVVGHVADRVAVMYLGELVEVGPAEQVFAEPSHPYTEALLAAVPSLQPDAEPAAPLSGSVPDATDPPSGCPFHPRCPAATPECAEIDPEFGTVGAARVRCLHAPDATGATEEAERADERRRNRPTQTR
ncbi:ABC transporter ATP-binding protein [Haloarculaceae archaeon H-GB11]|nr:ABC transporter ATP-binding protein [Haloarculaceae archaeon H-GB11]